MFIHIIVKGIRLFCKNIALASLATAPSALARLRAPMRANQEIGHFGQ